MVCPDGRSKDFYKDVPESTGKILFDIKGADHFEPTGLGDNSEVPAIAFFLTCWVRGEHCEQVYGRSGKEICNQIKRNSTLDECLVVGAGPGVLE